MSDRAEIQLPLCASPWSEQGPATSPSCCRRHGALSPSEKRRERAAARAHESAVAAAGHADFETPQQCLERLTDITLPALRRSGMASAKKALRCPALTQSDANAPRWHCPAACWTAWFWCRAALIKQGSELLRAHGGSLVHATIVSGRDRRAAGELETFNPVTPIQRVKRHLSHLNIVAIGGVDVTWNQEGAADDACHWQPHLHLIIAGTDRHALKKALGRQRYGSVHRPVHLQRVDDKELASKIGYSFNRVFRQRVGPEKTGCERQVDRPLPRDLQTELERWLLRQRVMDMLVLVGIRRQHDKLKRFERGRS